MNDPLYRQRLEYARRERILRTQRGYRTGILRGSVGGLGGAARLLGSEADGLAIDFTDLSMVIRDTGTPANAFLGNPNAKLTYASPSTKWILNRSGIYESGTALRTEYDTTGTALGLRVEAAATNLFLDSRSPATQGVSVTAVAHTLSFIGTGTITLSGASTAGPLVGTGANNRVTLTFTPSAGTLTCTVSGTMDFVQLETGSFATSPIVTAGSTVTRAADDVTIPTSLFIYSATAGILAVSARRLETVNANVGALASFDDGTSSNGHRFSYNGGHVFTSVVAGVNQAQFAGFGTTLTTDEFRIAASWTANDFAATLNGGTVFTDVLGSLPTVTRLGIANNAFSLGVGNFHISSLVYLPRNRASNAELQGFLA